MTIVRQNIASSFDNYDSLNLLILSKFVGLGTTQIKAFWWYIHAYATILGVMLSTLICLIYLIIHRSLSKLLTVLMHRDEWRISSTK